MRYLMILIFILGCKKKASTNFTKTNSNLQEEVLVKRYKNRALDSLLIGYDYIYTDTQNNQVMGIKKINEINIKYLFLKQNNECFDSIGGLVKLKPDIEIDEDDEGYSIPFKVYSLEKKNDYFEIRIDADSSKYCKFITTFKSACDNNTYVLMKTTKEPLHLDM